MKWGQINEALFLVWRLKKENIETLLNQKVDDAQELFNLLWNEFIFDAPRAVDIFNKLIENI